MNFTKKDFGVTKKNEPVSVYRLENASGAYIDVLDYGCRLYSICVPDRTGTLRDVCLAYPTIADYEADTAYFGAAIGRFGNRIRNASFTLNGKTYDLAKNDGNNHLHGGEVGFARCVWNTVCEDNKLIFTKSFADGEDNYPGNLDVTIIYEWTEENRLNITYEAVSDADTILNVTNHTYFNLEGTGSTTVENHELCLAASATTTCDSELLPTGEFAPVEGTPFDFRTKKAIGRDINEDNQQLIWGGGYDHNFVLDGEGFRKIAVLEAPATGISMTCFTDQPGIQIYTGNMMNPSTGKYGEALGRRNGMCMETQHYPDSVNIPHFPSVELKAGARFYTATSYEFGTF